QAAGYPPARDFDELIHILAWELRLITPVDPDGSSVERPSAGHPAHVPTGRHDYQLTHDYLVHSLRDWLGEKQSRAEVLLADLAALWGVRPERRHLPSWTESLYLLFGTRRRDRSAPQQTLMRAAARHHGARLALFAACLLVVAAWAWYEIHER